MPALVTGASRYLISGTSCSAADCNVAISVADLAASSFDKPALNASSYAGPSIIKKPPAQFVAKRADLIPNDVPLNRLLAYVPGIMNAPTLPNP